MWAGIIIGIVIFKIILWSCIIYSRQQRTAQLREIARSNTIIITPNQQGRPTSDRVFLVPNELPPGATAVPGNHGNPPPAYAPEAYPAGACPPGLVMPKEAPPAYGDVAMMKA